jgi:hypothetical protein
MLLICDELSGNGPWMEAILCLQKCQEEINEILLPLRSKFPLSQVDFFENDERNISSELADIFENLQNIIKSGNQNQFLAKQAIVDLKTYIKEKMVPNLLKLEIILIINAFLIKNKLIGDIFYCYDENKRRVLRDSKDDFYHIVSGPFLSLFYKVSENNFIKLLIFVCH